MVTDLPNNLKLPSNITYIQGTDGVWEPEFESDFDKAVFYAGKSPNPRSKNQKNVIKWIYSLGISFDEIKDHRKKILAKLKNLTTKDGAWDDYPNVLVPPVFQSFSIEQDEDDDDEMPEGLDDLIKDIGGRDTPDPPGALATIPKKPDDLVDEEIDSQILSILGLKDVFDLTYEEYASLLKEAAIKGRMSDSQMTTESIELITNELKRVKNLSGPFRVKQKKVNIDKVFNRKPGAIVKTDNLKQEDLKEDKQNLSNDSSSDDLQRDINDGIGNVLESLITIRSLLDEQNKTDRDVVENERKKNDKERKRQRENKLERTKSFSLPTAISKPISGFFDAIKNFFKNVLIGSAVLAAFRWLRDPKNKQSIDNFFEFVNDKIPLILKGLLALVALNIGLKIFGFVSALFSAFSWLKNRLPGARRGGGGGKGGGNKGGGGNTKPKPNTGGGGFFGRLGTRLKGMFGVGRNAYSSPIGPMPLDSGPKGLGGWAKAGAGEVGDVYGNVPRLASQSKVGFFSKLGQNARNLSLGALRGTGSLAMKALGPILRVLDLYFLYEELKQDYAKGDWYAIVVKIAAYGAGWLVTSLGFAAGAALGVTGFLSPAGLAVAVLSIAAGKGAEYAVRYFLLRREQKKSESGPRQKLIPDDSKSQSAQTQTQTATPTQSLVPGSTDYELGTTVPGGSFIQGNTGKSRGDHFHIGPETELWGKEEGKTEARRAAFKVAKALIDKKESFTFTNANISINPNNPPDDATLKGYIEMEQASHASRSGGGSFGGIDMAGRTGLPMPLGVSDVRDRGDGFGISGTISGTRAFVGHGMAGSTATLGVTAVRPGSVRISGRPSPPAISSPSGRSGIGGVLPLPVGGSQQPQSGSSQSQTRVLSFSSEDPNNMTTMVVKAIYNVVG